jgi:biopolymer transport protein ExbD
MSFVELDQDSLRLNGEDVTLAALPGTFQTLSPDAATLPVLLSLGDDVTAQRLTDILVILRGIDRLRISVLGS